MQFNLRAALYALDSLAFHSERFVYFLALASTMSFDQTVIKWSFVTFSLNN